MENAKIKILALVLLAISLGLVAFQMTSTKTQTTDEPNVSPATSEQEDREQESEIACTLNFDPVCGKVNGEEQSFGNSCEAEKAGALEIVEGLCSPLESCPTERVPVCGTVDGNRTNFDNLCIAEAAGATEIEEGNCPAPTQPEPTDELSADCPDDEAPVCGLVGSEKKDFKNECLAKNAEAREITEGECTLTPDSELETP